MSISTENGPAIEMEGLTKLRRYAGGRSPFAANRTGNDVRPHRPQWRRQVDHHQDADGLVAADRGDRPHSRPRSV